MFRFGSVEFGIVIIELSQLIMHYDAIPPLSYPMLHFPIQTTSTRLLFVLSSEHIKKKNKTRSTLVKLFLGSAALGTLSIGSVDVVLGDPALVVLASDACGISGNGLGLEGLAGLFGGRLLGGLGEEGLDPGLVDEVDGASEGASEDEVEEDAVACVSTV